MTSPVAPFQRFAFALFTLCFLGVNLAVFSSTQAQNANQSQKGATQNPTGLQIGVAPEGAGELLPGTEELSRQGAMASAEKNWRQAKLIYEEMLVIAPTNPLALSNLGAVEFRLKNMRRAEELLLRSTEIAPELAQNWMTLGLIYHDQGKDMLAISALSRALHEDPNDPRIHNFMGVVIRKQGWVIGSELELQRALLLDPTYADAHYNLAIMYMDKNLVELAKRHYNLAIDNGAAPDKRLESELASKSK